MHPHPHAEFAEGCAPVRCHARADRLAAPEARCGVFDIDAVGAGILRNYQRAPLTPAFTRFSASCITSPLADG